MPSPSDFQSVFGTVPSPAELGNLNAQSGASAIGTFLTNIVVLLYAAAGIICVFMIVMSAFQWITSGGEKEAIAKARGRLTYAIIGIVILSLTFAILNLLGNYTNIHLFNGQATYPDTTFCQTHPTECTYGSGP